MFCPWGIMLEISARAPLPLGPLRYAMVVQATAGKRDLFRFAADLGVDFSKACQSVLFPRI